MTVGRDRRRGRSGVFRLNAGSSPFGRHQSFRLNQPGGTFGSGRTAGGGAGAGRTLAESLLAPAPSTMGSFEVGPPPVEQESSGLSQALAPSPPGLRPPSFDPQPVPLAPIRGTTPIFNPNIISALRPPRSSGTTIRFF